MICRTFTVPTPKGTYFQKLRDQKTGTVRELRPQVQSHWRLCLCRGHVPDVPQ